MTNFNTRDVYHIMNVALMEKNYYMLSIEEKRKEVTECFNNYFAYKISCLHANLLKSEECITPIDYLRLLESTIEENHMDSLSHPVHFLLSLISGLQSYEILWIIDDSLDKPLITCDTILRDFATSTDVSMVSAFGVLYEYFMTSPNLVPSSDVRLLRQ